MRPDKKQNFAEEISDENNEDISYRKTTEPQEVFEEKLFSSKTLDMNNSSGISLDISPLILSPIKEIEDKG